MLAGWPLGATALTIRFTPACTRRETEREATACHVDGEDDDTQRLADECSLKRIPPAAVPGCGGRLPGCLPVVESAL